MLRDGETKLSKQFAALGRAAKIREIGALPRRVESLARVGQARTHLEYGQRKYLHSDKVFLRPGPEEEIDVVKMIFRWFLEEKIYYETIAKRLKAMGVLPANPHPAWNKPIIWKNRIEPSNN